MSPEQQKRRADAEAEALHDITSKTVEQLAKDVAAESVNAPQETIALARLLARFAAMLVVLSRKAEASADKMERYTNVLICLTIAIGGLTAVGIVVAALQLYFLLHPPEHP